MLSGIKKAVFFGAHTDDEMVCAGTLHRLVRQGTEVHLRTMSFAATEGDRRGNSIGPEVLDEQSKACRMIGVKIGNAHVLNLLPSSDFQPHRQAICQWVYDFCEREKPDCAFVLSPDDENTAHSIVGVESERVMRGRVPLVIRCQFPWNINVGRSNLFVSLSEEDMRIKRAVINAYQSQKFRYDYETMLMSQVVADGLSVKVPAAEKFEVVRAVL